MQSSTKTSTRSTRRSLWPDGCGYSTLFFCLVGAGTSTWSALVIAPIAFMARPSAASSLIYFFGAWIAAIVVGFSLLGYALTVLFGDMQITEGHKRMMNSVIAFLPPVAFFLLFRACGRGIIRLAKSLYCFA